jgi:hypothetical protein
MPLCGLCVASVISLSQRRFDLRKLNNGEVKKEYQVKISNRFAALENLDDNVDILSALENIRENIEFSAKESLGQYELKQHKPWFGEESSELLGRRNQAKLQWLQNPSQINGDNMDNVRREDRNFRVKNNICYRI